MQKWDLNHIGALLWYHFDIMYVSPKSDWVDLYEVMYDLVDVYELMYELVDVYEFIWCKPHIMYFFRREWNISATVTSCPT